MSRPLAVCADDFGAAPNITEAVVDLIAHGRLSAVSCLVNGEHWKVGAPLLCDTVRSRSAAVISISPSPSPSESATSTPATAAVDVGLHLNLTEGRPLSPELARHWPRLPSLPRLILLAHVGLLPLVQLRAELEAQLGAFTSATGRPPDFVDGHQHVHHLPGVRALVLDAVEHITPVPAMRNTGRVVGPPFAVKRALIEATGGRALQRQLARRGIACNAALTGVYDFTAALPYRTLMRGWLEALPSDGGLLFCHPATGTTHAAGDPIGAARVREFDYLRSADFAADLAAADVSLKPVWRMSSAA